MATPAHEQAAASGCLLSKSPRGRQPRCQALRFCSKAAHSYRTAPCLIHGGAAARARGTCCQPAGEQQPRLKETRLGIRGGRSLVAALCPAGVWSTVAPGAARTWSGDPRAQADVGPPRQLGPVCGGVGTVARAGWWAGGKQCLGERGRKGGQSRREPWAVPGPPQLSLQSQHRGCRNISSLHMKRVL